MKILIFFVMFLLVGAFFIEGKEKLALQEKKQREKFFGLYLEWLSSVFDNTRTITGQVFHLDWLPQEERK